MRAALPSRPLRPLAVGVGLALAVAVTAVVAYWAGTRHTEPEPPVPPGDSAFAILTSEYPVGAPSPDQASSATWLRPVATSIVVAVRESVGDVPESVEQSLTDDPSWVREAMDRENLAVPSRLISSALDARVALASSYASGQGEPELRRWASLLLDNSSAPVPPLEKAVLTESLKNLSISTKPELNGRWGEVMGAVREMMDQDARKARAAHSRVPVVARTLLLQSYARALDPHSNYTPPPSPSAQGAATPPPSASTSGISQSGDRLDMSAVGVETQKVATGLKITSIHSGGAEDRAGLRKGDIILGASASKDDLAPGKGAPSFLGAARPGESLWVLFRRGGADSSVRVEYRGRDRLRFDESKVGNLRVGRISVPVFYTDGLSDDMAEMVASRPGVGAFTLDLRGNPGGALASVPALLSVFMPPRPVVLSVSSVDATRMDTAGAPLWTGPLTVLVDGSTASAAELAAGALQDYRRAAVIGAKTFGKGTGQTTVGLPDGASVTVSVERIYRPSGASTQGVGVTPDVTLAAKPDAPTPPSERDYANAQPSSMVRPFAGSPMPAEYTRVDTQCVEAIRSAISGVSSADRAAEISGAVQASNPACAPAVAKGGEPEFHDVGSKAKPAPSEVAK